MIYKSEKIKINGEEEKKIRNTHVSAISPGVVVDEKSF